MVQMDIDEWILPFKEEIKRMTNDVDIDQLLKLVKQIDRSTAVTARLRKKPKRATKFSHKIKQIVNWLKLLTKNQSPENQTEMHPAFGLLLQHYINIVLLSTLGAKEINTKKTAETILGYVKLIVDGEPEWTLDVILSSNAKHSLQYHQGSVGTWLLRSVLADSVYYQSSLEDMDVFTKFLAVGKFLLKSDKREHGLSCPEVVEQIPILPKQLYNIYRQKKSGKRQRLDKSQIVTLLLETSKANKVAKACKERLIITTEDDVEENDDDEKNFTLSNNDNTTMGNDLFFMDTVGNQDIVLD